MSVLSLPIEPQTAKNGDMYYNSVEQKYYSFKDGEWVEQVDTENATSIVQEVVDDEGYLKNTAVGTDSITVGGTPIVSSVKNGVNIGVNSTATRTGATAVGMTALAEGAGATAIGNGAKVVNNSHRAIALGYRAYVTGAESAIQIGCGTNSTPKTLSIGFYDDTTPVNYELLSADGTIPTGRYKIMIGADGTSAGTKGVVPAPGATDNTKFLRGDGTWAEVQSGDSLPAQTGHAGEFLTTDGTDASWTIVPGGASSLTDIATAGDNITFTTPTIDDYTVVGSPTILSGVISNFSDTSYITMNKWNSVSSAGSFEFNTKFNVPSLKSNNFLCYSKTGQYGSDLFCITINSDGGLTLKHANDYYNAPSGSVGTNTDYWLRIIYNSSTNTTSIQLSTNGSTYTEIKNTGDFAYSTTSLDFVFGSKPAAGSNFYFTGSIDLTETNFKDGDGNVIWAASALSGLPHINATVPTVDQTYRDSSTNAQSGTAVSGAIGQFLLTGTTAPDTTTIGTLGQLYKDTATGILYKCSAIDTTDPQNPVYTWNALVENIATGSSSISIGNKATAGTGAVNIGYASQAIGYGTSIGYNAKGSSNGVAIGNGASGGYGAGSFCVALGTGSNCGGSGIGAFKYATALGAYAKPHADSAIQIGYGENTTASTLSVGFYDETNPVNYELLSADGTIPSARMPSDVLKNATTQTNGLAILGTTTASANATAIGKDSLASYITTAVGTNSKSYGVMSVSVGGWSNAGNSANVVSAIAIGAGAQALASGAIQLGNGVNSDAKTFKVALTDSQNMHAAIDEASGLFTLLDSSGKIPMARLPFQKVCANNTALTSDGTNCEWVITHNLGTKDVMVSVYDLTTDVEPLYNVEHTSTNTITIIFNSATDIPADSYRAVIIG